MFANERKEQLNAAAVALPVHDLDDPLLLHRREILLTLDDRPTRARLRLTLVQSCLAWLAIDLASEAASLDLVSMLPLHLRCRLATLAQLVAPLSDAAAQSLFLTQQPSDSNEEEWDSTHATSEAEALEQLDLAFSHITITSFQRILFTQDTKPRLHYPFLSSLNLSGSVHLSLSFTLVQLLSSIRNLRHLYLAKMPLLRSVESTTLMVKLASATSRLEELDLSHNNWVTFKCITVVEWPSRWTHLDKIGLKDCPSLRPPTPLKRSTSIGSGMRLTSCWSPAHQDHVARLERRGESVEVESPDPQQVKQAVQDAIMAQKRRWMDVIV